jgi:hypothetical protein
VQFYKENKACFREEHGLETIHHPSILKCQDVSLSIQYLYRGSIVDKQKPLMFSRWMNYWMNYNIIMKFLLIW